MKRKISFFLALGLVLGGFLNCYGKFGMIKTVYSINGNINIGSGKVSKFFKSVLMIFPFSFAYGVGGVLDFLLFNVIEFWTDSNPVSKADFDFEGKMVKVAQDKGQSVTLTYLDWGKILRVETESKHGKESVYFLKEHPQKAFALENGSFVEISKSKLQLSIPEDAKHI